MRPDAESVGSCIMLHDSAATRERMKRWTVEQTAGVTRGYAHFSYDSAATRERKNEEMDGGADRRRHPRLRAPFPAIVRGKDASGESFGVKAVLDDISA